jgi:3-methyladenine DNA glycosylase AlkD
MKNYNEILDKLRSMSNPESVVGMAKYGINPKHALGISIPNLRKLAKETGKNHILAQELWKSEIHEARILASMVDDPKLVSENQMESWVKDFNSWDLCDQCCGNLFDKTPFAYQKAVEWSSRKEEFVKRSGFALIAWLAVHDKKATDKQFEEFFPHIKRESIDERNYVKKAVNWALRQIGKRNLVLNKAVINLGKEIKQIDSKSARWIANNALKELTNSQTLKRIKSKFGF